MQFESKILVFSDFSHLLAQADSLANPAEIHGILCGLICTGQKIDGKFWFHMVLKLFETRAHISSRHRGMILELYDATCRQFSGVGSEFELLLPDVQQTLKHRAESLSQWCQGFLYGLKLADNTIIDETSEEAREALHCISEIARLDYANIEVREIDENAYAGVVEYVRSAAIVLYTEFADGHSGSTKNNKNDKSAKTVSLH